MLKVLFPSSEFISCPRTIVITLPALPWRWLQAVRVARGFALPRCGGDDRRRVQISGLIGGRGQSVQPDHLGLGLMRIEAGGVNAGRFAVGGGKGNRLVTHEDAVAREKQDANRGKGDARPAPRGRI